ncbi:MAG: c-type cytochrome, partial [Planctomycetaceae bacterium]
YGHRPSQGTFGIRAAKVIAPGDPYRSVLLYRMAKLGRGRMPHFGSGVVDRMGLRLIHDWIDSLDRGPTANPTVESARRQLLKIRFATMMNPPLRENGIRRLVTPMLSSTEGALVLATQLGREGFNAKVNRWIIDFASGHPDPQIRDLFEPFLPEEKRTKRLGTTVDAVALLKLKGDVARGRALFLRTAGVSCINCHKIQGRGKDVGPDLSHIAKKNTRAQLLESIPQPSKTIDRKYLVYLVETKKGRVFSGLLKQRDAKQVVLTDPQGKAIRIPAGDVELIVPQRKSLMPELLFRDMTARQLADLLQFLQSLK